MARHGGRAPVPFRRWKDNSDVGDDDTDEDGGPAGQTGHAYEVTVRYKLV